MDKLETNFYRVHENLLCVPFAKDKQYECSPSLTHMNWKLSFIQFTERLVPTNCCIEQSSLGCGLHQNILTTKQGFCAYIISDSTWHNKKCHSCNVCLNGSVLNHLLLMCTYFLILLNQDISVLSGYIFVVHSYCTCWHAFMTFK